MSAETLIQALEGMPPDEPLDWPDFSERLEKDFATAQTSEERSQLLALRAVAIDRVVHELDLDSEQLEKFTDVCEMEYKRLIVRETLVNGVVSYQQLLQVTDREIAAGRMSDDYALRALALEESPGAANPNPAQSMHDHAESFSGLAKLKHWLHLD